MKTIIQMIVRFAFLTVLTLACNIHTPDNRIPPVSIPRKSSEITIVTVTALLPSMAVVVEDTDVPLSITINDFMSPDSVNNLVYVRQALLQGNIFNLDVAYTDSTRAIGLMGRTSLSDDEAMLFVYEDAEYRNFWMKDTLIPLDILFLDAHGIVVDVQTMDTQIGVMDRELKIYSSSKPARFALEMKAGLADNLEITAGVFVLFR